MLNESTITQAKEAILSRHTTLKEAFFSHTEDGIFAKIAMLYYPERFGRDLQHYEWQLNDRAEAERIANVRRVFLGFEILSESRMLDI